MHIQSKKSTANINGSDLFDIRAYSMTLAACVEILLPSIIILSFVYIYTRIHVRITLVMIMHVDSVMIFVQKVDYDYMHQKHSGLSYVRDPMKGSTYEMLDLPIPEGPVSRPRIIIPNPVFDDAYPSAYPKTYGQWQSFSS